MKSMKKALPGWPNATAPVQGLAAGRQRVFGGVAERIIIGLRDIPCPKEFKLAQIAGAILALPGIIAHREVQSALSPLLPGRGWRARTAFRGGPANVRGISRYAGIAGIALGGEPLLYSRWQDLNERLPEFELRLVLLSNGLLLTDKVIGQLKVDEVQLSLDGMETGHELIRGKGTWKKTVERLEALQAAGLEVSVATMIHRGNLEELEKMQNWLQKLGIREWNLDIPCISGRLSQNQDLWLDPEEAAHLLRFWFWRVGSRGYVAILPVADIWPRSYPMAMWQNVVYLATNPWGAWTKGWKIVGYGYNTSV